MTFQTLLAKQLFEMSTHNNGAHFYSHVRDLPDGDIETTYGSMSQGYHITDNGEKQWQRHYKRLIVTIFKNGRILAETQEWVETGRESEPTDDKKTIKTFEFPAARAAA